MKGLSKQRIATAIARYAPINGIRSAYLFGSHARGDADEHSDVDLCIEADEGFTLFALGGFGKRMEDDLGCPVDIVCGENAFYPKARERYQRDKVLLYAQS